MTHLGGDRDVPRIGSPLHHPGFDPATLIAGDFDLAGGEVARPGTEPQPVVVLGLRGVHNADGEATQLGIAFELEMATALRDALLTMIPVSRDSLAQLLAEADAETCQPSTVTE